MDKYRPNVAVLITDGLGRVLLCRRVDDESGTAQTVQGGIDAGETPLAAAIREVHEEIGLEPNQFEIIASSETKYRYVWPLEFQQRLGFTGQEQQFFLFKVSPDCDFHLDRHHREFSQVEWGTPNQLVDQAWEVKKPGLRGALTEFGLLPRDTETTIN
ncbi:MAG: NUDIX domain-containing protein [Patescibacteria group bacterium]